VEQATVRRAEESEIDNFAATTDFALEVIIGIEDYGSIPLIISHCLVNSTPRVNEFLKRLTGTEYPQVSQMAQVLDET
jgi:hypothetical protein